MENRKSSKKRKNYNKHHRKNNKREPKGLQQFSSPSMWLKRDIVVMTNQNKNRKKNYRKKAKYYVCKYCGTNVPANPNIPANQMFCPRCMKPMEPL